MKTVEEIERITLAVMKKVAKEEFGDDFDVDDPVDPDDMRFMVKVMSGVLAAVDAERGKKAVAWVEVINRHEGPYNFHGKELLDSGKHNLFLSPTIPEGECGCKLVPDYDAIRDAERYRFLRDEENWVDDDPDFAIRPWETLGESSGKEFDSTIDSYMEHRKAIIKAVGVTK